MKQTTFGVPLLRTLLGAAALLSSTAFAHAAGPFIAGSHWTGFRVSTVGGGTSNAKLDVSNNPNIGVLNMTGQPVVVVITCSASGAVSFQGTGAFFGVRAYGAVAAQGGTFSLSSNYTIVSAPGMHDDSGRLSLLRSYAKPTVGTIGGGGGIGSVPPDPYFGLIPPDPYFGTFVSASGIVGRMVLEHNPPADINEHNPPADFVGNAYFNDGKYAVVGTVNPIANADGSRTIEMLGESPILGSIAPCVKTYGLLLPAVRIGGPTSIQGNYTRFGPRFSDQGRFQIGQ